MNKRNIHRWKWIDREEKCAGGNYYSRMKKIWMILKIKSLFGIIRCVAVKHLQVMKGNQLMFICFRFRAELVFRRTSKRVWRLAILTHQMDIKCFPFINWLCCVLLSRRQRIKRESNEYKTAWFSSNPWANNHNTSLRAWDETANWVIRMRPAFFLCHFALIPLFLSMHIVCTFCASGHRMQVSRVSQFAIVPVIFFIIYAVLLHFAVVVGVFFLSQHIFYNRMRLADACLCTALKSEMGQRTRRSYSQQWIRISIFQYAFKLLLFMLVATFSNRTPIIYIYMVNIILFMNYEAWSESNNWHKRKYRGIESMGECEAEQRFEVKEKWHM